MQTAIPERASEQVAASFTAEQVEAALDLLRPAIANHGGSIHLVGVEGRDVRVLLEGSCVGCPSSTVTLRYGVERLLREELPGFGELLADEPPPPVDTRPRWWQRLLDR